MPPASPRSPSRPTGGKGTVDRMPPATPRSPSHPTGGEGDAPTLSVCFSRNSARSSRFWPDQTSRAGTGRQPAEEVPRSRPRAAGPGNSGQGRLNSPGEGAAQDREGLPSATPSDNDSPTTMPSSAAAPWTSSGTRTHPGGGELDLAFRSEGSSRSDGARAGSPAPGGGASCNQREVTATWPLPSTSNPEGHRTVRCRGAPRTSRRSPRSQPPRWQPVGRGGFSPAQSAAEKATRPAGV